MDPTACLERWRSAVACGDVREAADACGDLSDEAWTGTEEITRLAVAAMILLKGVTR